MKEKILEMKIDYVKQYKQFGEYTVDELTNELRNHFIFRFNKYPELEADVNQLVQKIIFANSKISKSIKPIEHYFPNQLRQLFDESPRQSDQSGRPCRT